MTLAQGIKAFIMEHKISFAIGAAGALVLIFAPKAFKSYGFILIGAAVITYFLIEPVLAGNAHIPLMVFNYWRW